MVRDAERLAFKSERIVNYTEAIRLWNMAIREEKVAPEAARRYAANIACAAGKLGAEFAK